LFKIGFVNSTLLNIFTDEGDIIKQLKEIGILNEKGTEHFMVVLSAENWRCNYSNYSS
jgi:hypothetical protein